MEEWKTYKIRDIATVNLSQYSLKEGWNEVTYLDTGSITENHIEDIQTFILPCDDFPSRARRKVQHNDILFSTVRPNQKHFGILKNPNDNLLVSTGFSVITVNPLVADANFVYYYITQQEIINYLQSVAEQSVSAYPSLKSSDIEDIDIELPSLYEQRRLALILKSLDDKIQLNNRINHNLEEQAQALYKSWFVDFEPFKGGKFVDSELGLIPEGWSCVSLTDISMVFDSMRKPLSGMQRENMKKLYPYYGATEIMDYVDNYIFDGIYLLIGEDGSVVRSNGAPFLQYVEGKFWSNNHAHVLQGTNGYSTEMLHCALLCKNIMHAVTGAVQAKLSQSNMRKILLVLPPKDISNAFDSIIQSIYNSKRTIERQNNNLSKQRDNILPKLMSGELKINDLTC